MKLAGVETADDGFRVYRWEDGAELPSVTTILDEDPQKKKAIQAYRSSHPRPDEYMNEQGLLGSIVHHRILNQYAIRPLSPPQLSFEVIERYGKESLRADIQTCEGMWDSVLEHEQVVPGHSPKIEKPVRSMEHGYAGRFDMLTTDGTLVDLKVSKSIYDSYKMQIAAYANAAGEMSEYPTPERAAIVGLHPHVENNPHLTPTVELITKQELDEQFENFTEVLDIFNSL